MREYVRFSHNKTVHGLIGLILDVMDVALVTLFLIILLAIYVFHFASVQGDSMLPTLENGNHLLVNALDHNPECGDIVIINTEHAGLYGEDGSIYETEGLHKVIVKRVIAVAGQTVDMDFSRGIVYLNNWPLDEPYINSVTTAPAMDPAFEYPITIPEGYVFVMGDNRAVSMDSRYSDVGLVSLAQIEGQVILRLQPFGTVS